MGNKKVVKTDAKKMNSKKKHKGTNFSLIEKKQMGVFGLAVLLIIVVVGSLLFVGAVSGWFSGEKVKLDTEYYCGEECDGEFMDLSKEQYEELIATRRTFVLLVDQGGCKTADRLREYMTDYAKEMGIRVYRIIFAEMKESSLHDFVKYYPSVVIVVRGKPLVWLEADGDEDANIYNDYNEFKAWIQKYMVI